MTVRSSRAARMYEPGTWISRVSPTPLLMIVGLDDTITLTDLALAGYERALQPKKLITIPGGHFEPTPTSSTRPPARPATGSSNTYKPPKPPKERNGHDTAAL